MRSHYERSLTSVRGSSLTYLITSTLIPRGFHPFPASLQNSDSATQYPQARPTRKVNSVANRQSSTQHGEHRSPRPAHASKGAQRGVDTLPSTPCSTDKAALQLSRKTGWTLPLAYPRS